MPGRKTPKKAASPKTSKPLKKTPPATTRERAIGVGAAVKIGIDISDLIDQLRRPQPEFRISVCRPNDMVVFDLIFQNLKFVSGSPPKLIRDDLQAATYFVVEFPPQSFGEEAYLDATGPDVTGSGPPFPETSPSAPKKNDTASTPAETLRPMPASRVRMAGKSRIAFNMPAGTTELGFDLGSVMAACRTWPQRRDALAAPEPSSRVVKQVGKAWLKDVTLSESWTTASSIILDGLQKATAPDIVKAVEDAGARIGNQAATALAANKTETLAAVLSKAFTAEADALAQKYPQLREGRGRDTTVAALSLKATESLAASKLSFGDDLTFVSTLPFLPVYLSPHRPGADVTSLELPYRVYISPIGTARWLHRDQPATDPRSGRTELWHTHLTSAPDNFGPDTESKMRAIWSPDYPIAHETIVSLLFPPQPFRMSLDPLDRQMLVKLMAGYDEATKLSPRVAYIPSPSTVHRLMLSALGGLLDTEGTWKAPRPVTIIQESPLVSEKIALEQWRHLATLGRDHYVKVVYAGYLMPFGHHASLIKVTERKFEPSDPNASVTEKRVAVLRQRFFIVVREHVKNYSGAGEVAGWFDFPFSQVEILTKVTPSLMAPDSPAGQVLPPPTRFAFWPMLTTDQNTGNFKFEIAATDISGKRVTFAMPLLFIGDEYNTDAVKSPQVVAAYNSSPEDPRRSGPTGGASICYAPIDPSKEGDPRLPTTSLVFSATTAGGDDTVPHFQPHLHAANATIRQIQRLLGQQHVVRVEYPDTYRASGFGANPGEVFLKLPTPHPLSFGGGAEVKSDSLGALASPGMAIQGLSRVAGPVAASLPSGGQTVEDTLKKVIGNTFDPVDFFKDAKILGGIDLSTVLKAVALTAGDVPKMVTQELPNKIESSFHWETEIKQSDPLNLLVLGAGGSTILSMDGKVSAPIDDPSGVTFNATASIVHFKVNLFGFIIIWFDSLTFKASRGTKPDVAVEMHPNDAVTFGGPLEFVNEIRQFIPSNGFSDPPSLAVTPSGISANYSLNLPSITVGIFGLTNVSLGAGFALPFDSRPVEVKFNFSEREHPFSLTVSLFSGGGFFAIGIGTEGVREIEAALEFGAAIAIDLGVASGGVEVKAGVYFHWLDPGGGQKTVELTGYVRLHGELSVLGLISASLTFNLQLGYLKQSGTSMVFGEASLEVEIDILFFSASVSVKCRREFGGSKSDPTFLEQIPVPALWADYCGAFAAE